MADSQATKGEDLEVVDLAGDGDLIRPMPKPSAELVQMAYDAIDGTLPDGAIGAVEFGDPDIIGARIRQEIRDAKTFDEAFGVTKLPAWGQIAGEPVIVHSFHFNPSDFSAEEGGAAAYAVVQLVRLATGELEVRQCGGVNVLTQLVWAWEHEAFPFTVKLVAKQTQDKNRTVYRLEKVEA